MKKWWGIVVALMCGCGALSVGACKPNPGVKPRTSVADGAAQSDALLARFLATEKPGCSGAVAQEGIVLWAGARGAADVTAPKPLTVDSIFDVASTSKQFTAIAILLVMQDGLLSLSDPLARFVQGMPAWASDVTVEQLMHHRSGIPDYTDVLVKRGVALTGASTQADALDAIAASKLDFAPGSKFAYSNSNYVLLAEVVQAATGKALPALLDERVFVPLNLQMRMNPLFESEETVVPYSVEGSKFVSSRSRWQQLGDGSIFTTPTQLARWGDNYRTGAIGGLDLIAAALDAAVSTDLPDDRYGPGIDIGKDGTLSHSGAWSGFATAFLVSPDRRTTLALSCNSFGADMATVGEGLQIIWF